MNEDKDALIYLADVRIDELQAENAKLRESVKRLMTQRDERLARAESENAKLRSARDVWQENDAKLRELVRDMYAVMAEDAANCDVTYPEQFDNRMRELGVDA